MNEQKNCALAAATAQGRTATNAKVCDNYYTTEERESQSRPLLDWECWPSVWETMQAKKVFIEKLQKEAADNVNSREMCVKLAIIEVWRQGRIYQKRKCEQ